MPRTILLLLLVLVLVGLTAAQPAAAAGPQDQVVISGDVNVPRDRTVGDVVVVDGSVAVAGRVEGDVIAVSGPVRVAGTVDGTITAVSDRLTLLPGARVTGDVFYGDERPVIASSATIGGKVSDEGWADAADFPWGAVGAVAWWVMVTASTLVLGLILVALAPRAADAVVAAARERLGLSLAWGAGLFVTVPILAVIALASLVGIPLGVGLLLALVPVAGLAYVATCYVLGRTLLKDPAGRIPAFLVGWAVLRAAALIPFAGILAWVAAIVVGVGVLVVATWRARGPRPAPASPSPPSTSPA
jgi:cytoskeletal protein CcmA (bactofilin family)